MLVSGGACVDAIHAVDRHLAFAAQRRLDPLSRVSPGRLVAEALAHVVEQGHKLIVQDTGKAGMMALGSPSAAGRPKSVTLMMFCGLGALTAVLR